MNAGLNEDAEVTIDFDDSIIEDKTTAVSYTHLDVYKRQTQERGWHLLGAIYEGGGQHGQAENLRGAGG